MIQPSLLEIKSPSGGAKFVPLATVKFIGGLQTQRSPFASIDTRYNTQYLGGKPDALIAGSNCEISNSLTLQRRPGNSVFGPAIPAALAFYEYKPSAPPSNQIIVDTAGAVYNYSSQFAGLLFYKSPSAGQTNFMTVVNTLYAANGVDAYKVVGPNLLTWANTFTNAVWTTFGTTFTLNQFDPLGGTNATLLGWTYGSSYVRQIVTPNYTPVSNNTFTFSVWLRANSGSPTVTIYCMDQSLAFATTQTVTLTQTWTRYQVTSTLGPTSTSVAVEVGGPSVTGGVIQIYGAQLEVGGPASPLQLTTNQPQGVYLWGIVAPTVAPAVRSAAVSGYWQAGTNYVVGNVITDSNGNKQVATTNGTSAGSAPTWTTTVGSTTTDNTVTWQNAGPNGLTPRSGYQWYYAYLDQYTGQPSNVSPISVSTTTLANNLGVQYTLQGTGSFDPQVNQVAIYRNVDGGPFWFQVATIPNPGGGNSWTFTDTTQDGALSSIYAPVGGLNSPPPSGAVNPVWYQSRAWVSVGANLFFSSSTDNAAILNIQLNGVVAESWNLAQALPLDQLIIRSLPTSAGLLVMTVGDFWVVTGSDLSSFNPVKALIGHGLRSYNAVDADGSSIWAYTSDRQFLGLNASAGSVELGYAIGDTLTNSIDPTKAYVVRHQGGSLDNAVFLADGSTGWYRMNPNQVGASVSGEPTAVWSPFATIVGGVGAIGSLETTPGVHQFLLSAPVTVGGTNILSLGQIATAGANSGSGTAWTNPNNLTLNNPATPATVTLNIPGGGTSGLDVTGGAQGTATSLSTGNITTTGANELLITGMVGMYQGPSPSTTTITPGVSWSLDYQNSFKTFHDTDLYFDQYMFFGSEHLFAGGAGTYAGTATLSRAQTEWDACIVALKSGNGTLPTVVQQASSSFQVLETLTNSSDTFSTNGSLTVSPSSAITLGNYLVIVVGVMPTVGASSVTVMDNLGNAFTRIGLERSCAIFLAPINFAGTDTVTVNIPSPGGAQFSTGIQLYEVNLPLTAGTLTSQQLQATNYGLNVPNNNIIGMKVYVTGSQSSSAPDATLTLSLISHPTATSYTFQLPGTTGTVAFGGSNATWGLVLTQSLLNASGFGPQVQASVSSSTNVTFNITAIQVQIFYLAVTPPVQDILVRNLGVFSDNGSTYTWNATIGSLWLASPGMLAETESVTTLMRAASATQVGVGVLLDEITGSFESLPNSVADPSQLAASSSVLGKRFYLAQGATPPICQHMQVQLTGANAATKDEVLALVVRGALVPEQIA